jgi:nucleoside-diphosphate-sugar epimerase
MKVMVTGANGLVGSALLRRLQKEPDLQLIAGLRSSRDCEGVDEIRILGDLTKGPLDAGILRAVDVVVHTAARVHIMKESQQDIQTAYRRVNVEGTRALLNAAVEAGVSRFIYISSIKVNGEFSLPGKPFSEKDEENPQDAYAHSKLEAEKLVESVCKQHGIEWVVVRPPLIYGYGVRANFKRMIEMLASGIPLPLGGLENKRSLLALENLTDFLACCITHPMAANECFMVSDGQDLTVTDLCRKILGALGARTWLIPIPGSWLKFLLRSIGAGAIAQRLCGELLIDSSKARNCLGWQPLIQVDDALLKTLRKAAL